MNSFREVLRSDKFLVTVTLSPPKGIRVESFLRTLESLSGKVDAVNLPDGRAATIHMGPLASSLLARERGLEPVFTLSCRDRNRLALSADLLGAYAMGIRSVLCVSGDYFTFGDTVDGKPVYDLDSVQAIQMIRQMEQGRDIGGNDLDGVPDFCVGCVANPQAVPLEPHLMKLEKKLRAGAEFIQTLDVYEPDRATAFFENLRTRDVKVLAGVRFVTDREVRLGEAGKFPGNPIPDSWTKEIEGIREEGEILKRAKARVVEMLRRFRDSGLCDGVHLTVDGHEGLIPEMLQEAGVR